MGEYSLKHRNINRVHEYDKHDMSDRMSFKIAQTTNQQLGNKHKRRQARIRARDRNRAGMSLSNCQGLGASKKQKWGDFEDFVPSSGPVVVR